MIRWTFMFNDDKHIFVDVNEEAEDTRIDQSLQSGNNLLFIPAPGKSVFVNLAITKLILREELEDASENPPPAEPGIESPPQAD